MRSNDLGRRIVQSEAQRVPCDVKVSYEFVGPLPCSLGKGHITPHRVDRSTVDVARLCRLSRYEAALKEIATLEEDCMCDDMHATTTRAQDRATEALEPGEA